MSGKEPKKQEEEVELKRAGIFSRALHYMQDKIQERAAPEIPVEDRQLNSALRERIIRTPEYRN